jgi:hypothetical protein
MMLELWVSRRDLLMKSGLLLEATYPQLMTAGGYLKFKCCIDPLNPPPLFENSGWAPLAQKLF